jgi:hypothetical protein
LAQNEPFVFPSVNKGLRRRDIPTATSIEYVQPVERTVSEILVRTPPHATAAKPFGGEFAWDGPGETRLKILVLWCVSKEKPSVEASPLPKMATQCTSYIL